MSIIKIEKQKTEHDGERNKLEHYWKWQIQKNEQHFYQGTQNRIQLHFGEPNNKHMQMQQRSNRPQNSQQKSLTKIFNQQLTSKHFRPATRISEDHKTI